MTAATTGAAVRHSGDSHRASRFDELAQLRDGWFNGEGRAIPADVLATGRALFAKLQPLIPYAIRVYPAVSGGLSFEWETGPRIAFVAELTPNDEDLCCIWVDCDHADRDGSADFELTSPLLAEEVAAWASVPRIA